MSEFEPYNHEQEHKDKLQNVAILLAHFEDKVDMHSVNIFELKAEVDDLARRIERVIP